MNIQLKTTVAFAIGMTLTFSSMATPTDEKKLEEQNSLQAVVDNFTKLVPIPIVTIEEAPLSNMLQVVTEKGVFYATLDGKHIIAGNIHEAKEGLPNLTRARLAKENSKKVDALKNDFITYKSENEKYEIVVFFDTSCPYCAKFHNEIEDFNKAGITVHYAAWPRQGVYNRQNKSQFTGAYYQLENIWCSDKPKQALDAALKRATIPRNSCENSIPEQFGLGVSLGVTGTPAVFSIDGQQLQRGYAPVEQLLKNIQGAQ